MHSNNLIQADSPAHTNNHPPSSPPPPSIHKKKTLLSRINQSNRTLGIFFGCLGGMILGIVLVIQHQATIAIIGASYSTILQIFTVFLAMGTGGNLCSYIGSCIDLITGDQTIFDGCASVYAWCKRGKVNREDERKE